MALDNEFDAAKLIASVLDNADWLGPLDNSERDVKRRNAIRMALLAIDRPDLLVDPESIVLKQVQTSQP